MPASKNVIYALSCTCHPQDGIRYVGLTSMGLTYRLARHRRDSRKDTVVNRMHLWMRDHDVVGEVLEEVLTQADSRDTQADLRVAEIRWMARLRGQGANLLNGTDFWKVVDGVWLRAS